MRKRIIITNKAVTDLARATTNEERAAIIAEVRLADPDLADTLAAKFSV